MSQSVVALANYARVVGLMPRPRLHRNLTVRDGSSRRFLLRGRAIQIEGEAMSENRRQQSSFRRATVLLIHDFCCEGVIWHEAHRAAYWTDINRFLVHRFTPKDKCVRSWMFDEPVTALSLTDRDNVLVVALGSRVILWEPETDDRHDPIFVLEG